MKVFGGHWGLKHPEHSVSNVFQGFQRTLNPTTDLILIVFGYHPYPYLSSRYMVSVTWETHTQKIQSIKKG